VTGRKGLRALQLDLRQLRLGGVEDGGRLRDIQIGSGATGAEILCQLQRAAKGINGIVHEVVLGIQRAQGEKIVGNFGGDV